MQLLLGCGRAHYVSSSPGIFASPDLVSLGMVNGQGSLLMAVSQWAINQRVDSCLIRNIAITYQQVSALNPMAINLMRGSWLIITLMSNNKALSAMGPSLLSLHTQRAQSALLFWLLWKILRFGCRSIMVQSIPRSLFTEKRRYVLVRKI